MMMPIAAVAATCMRGSCVQRGSSQPHSTAKHLCSSPKEARPSASICHCHPIMRLPAVPCASRHPSRCMLPCCMPHHPDSCSMSAARQPAPATSHMAYCMCCTCRSLFPTLNRSQPQPAFVRSASEGVATHSHTWFVVKPELRCCIAQQACLYPAACCQAITV
jgi:hypothetical protein